MNTTTRTKTEKTRASSKNQVSEYIQGMFAMQRFLAKQVELKICSDYQLKQSCIHHNCKTYYDLMHEIAGDFNNMSWDPSK